MKKHFILLGKAGLIYFSWLFILLFISLVIAFEGTDKINWTSIGFLIVFLLGLIYTLITSYYDEQYVKLPYQRKKQISHQAKIIWHFKQLSIQEITLNQVKTISFLQINFKRAK